MAETLAQLKARIKNMEERRKADIIRIRSDFSAAKAQIALDKARALSELNMQYDNKLAEALNKATNQEIEAATAYDRLLLPMREQYAEMPRGYVPVRIDRRFKGHRDVHGGISSSEPSSDADQWQEDFNKRHGR